jgi:N-methylhydantoinase A
MRAAIDTGGTFTDVILYSEETGELWTVKVPSSTKKPEQAFIKGLTTALSAAGTTFPEVNILVHGTTVVTNTLLQQKTAKAGLLVTEGFSDVLEIARQQRPFLYDLMADRRIPLVPRHLVREIEERVGADGQELIPLNPEKAKYQIQSLHKQGVESLAIVLLFSFLKPENENKLAELAREFFPEHSVFISSYISAEFREFERTSTTVVAASVAPGVRSYLQGISKKLDVHSWKEDNLFIMHSGGGTLPPSEAIKKPHTMIESGPAAGIIAAAQLAQKLELDRVIAFDMGGTTAKAGLILNKQPLYTTEYEVGEKVHSSGWTRGSGYPVRFPMIDVAECGSGAGSIAWIDPGGHLKVGPESAGADPGPACYGKGGSKPTVTDAYLELGYLDRDSFLGGDMLLDPKLATNALQKHISKHLSVSAKEAAAGVVTIANDNMLHILRLVSVMRGYDPRDFTLVAYGGAGPIHATMLAEKLSIRKVIIPKYPGLFSALGLLYSDVSTDFVETIMTTLEPDNVDLLNNILDRLNIKADSWFERMKALGVKLEIKTSIDLRYLRQNYEINIPLPGVHLSSDYIISLQRKFHEAHKTKYGHSTPGETIQTVYVRLRALKLLTKPDLKPLKNDKREITNNTSHKNRKIWFPEGEISCPVYERNSLSPKQKLEGPLIIQEKEATTLVERDWSVQVDNYCNLMLKRK